MKSTAKRNERGELKMSSNCVHASCMRGRKTRGCSEKKFGAIVGGVAKGTSLSGKLQRPRKQNWDQFFSSHSHT